MKKTMLSMGVIVLSALSVSAQTTPTPDTWESRKNPTVAAILSKYESGTVTTRPALTQKDIFPALGQYQVSSPEAMSLTITQDEQNKGIVYISGLPQGTVKAMIRKSPATYIIHAQKTPEGTAIPEGTLLYDNASNNLQICLGRSFNDADPWSVFTPLPVEEKPATPAKGKTKIKKPAAPTVWLYSGTKILEEKATAVNR